MRVSMFSRRKVVSGSWLASLLCQQLNKYPVRGTGRFNKPSLRMVKHGDCAFYASLACCAVGACFLFYGVSAFPR
jgi:hypothetical protein